MSGLQFSILPTDIGSADDFCAQALRIYMSHFDFAHNSLDVALRKLLMQMSLPPETQQIDRIVEAFAVRYEECEPGLFVHKGAGCPNMLLLTIRQHIRPRFFDDDAPYRRLQQAQQEQDD